MQSIKDIISENYLHKHQITCPSDCTKKLDRDFTEWRMEHKRNLIISGHYDHLTILDDRLIDNINRIESYDKKLEEWIDN